MRNRMMGGLFLIVVLASCSVVRPNKYFTSDSIRIYTDTFGTKVVGTDTIRYRNSRVVTKERNPLRIGQQEITKWEAATLALLLAILVLMAVKK